MELTKTKMAVGAPILAIMLSGCAGSNGLNLSGPPQLTPEEQLAALDRGIQYYKDTNAKFEGTKAPSTGVIVGSPNPYDACERAEKIAAKFNSEKIASAAIPAWVAVAIGLVVRGPQTAAIAGGTTLAAFFFGDRGDKVIFEDCIENIGYFVAAGGQIHPGNDRYFGPGGIYTPGASGNTPGTRRSWRSGHNEKGEQTCYQQNLDTCEVLTVVKDPTGSQCRSLQGNWANTNCDAWTGSASDSQEGNIDLAMLDTFTRSVYETPASQIAVTDVAGNEIETGDATLSRPASLVAQPA